MNRQTCNHNLYSREEELQQQRNRLEKNEIKTLHSDAGFCGLLVTRLGKESVVERVGVRVESRVERMSESGASVGDNGAFEYGVIGLSVLVQIDAAVHEIVEKFRWFVGKNSHLALSASALGGNGSGGLDERVGEGSAVRICRVSSARSQIRVRVVAAGQECGSSGVDWDVRLAVLVQIDALRVQVIHKLGIVRRPLAVRGVLGRGAGQEDAQNLFIVNNAVF